MRYRLAPAVSLAAATLAIAAVAVIAAPPETVNRRWLERLEAEDRAIIDGAIGYGPPPFTTDLVWFGSGPMTWKDLRGKVVVVQAWTKKNARSRGSAVRLMKSLGDAVPDDVVILALHTPEDVDGIEPYLERKPLEVPVIVDRHGVFCDELGIYRAPVNIVVNRDGTVRYAGLNARGVLAAVKSLMAASPDPSAEPATRLVPETTEPVTFPPCTGSVGKAKDFRNRAAPPFHVAQWVTNRPDPTDKVVLLDFWATWCGPCIASVPHMNQLADRFRDSVCVVGISSEKASDFQSGLQKLERSKGLTLDGFRYAIAIDPDRRMMGVMGITAIPHAVVMSRDWVVRWQGNPTGLSPEVLEQIIAADRSGGPDARRYRWTREMKRAGDG